MILERLRTETKEAHQALEKLIIPTLKNATTNNYTHLLNVFYGYYQPLEQTIDKYINDKIIPNYSNRRKANIILDDIKAISNNAVQTAICPTLPAITNVQEALGAMYVLEGSTLGGKIISKMLKQQLQIADNNGVAFFGGYGAETDDMWASFTQTVNNYPATEAEKDEMVNAATDTFVKFREWITVNNH